MSTTIRMPELGESVVEGTVGKWLVAEGQAVQKDQALVEILTDKADSEIPAPEAGQLTRILVKEGDVVAVGDALCEVADASVAAPAKKPAKASANAAVETPKQAMPLPPAQSPGGNGADPGAIDVSAPPASPSVRRLARERGVDLDDLRGSGSGGRVTRDDVLGAADDGTTRRPTLTGAVVSLPPTRAPQPGSVAAPVVTRVSGSGAFRPPPYVPKPGDEIVPMSRRRRIIADHMVYSKVTAPHVVTLAECDLHATKRVRAAHKDALKREGVNLTFLAFVAQATARALGEFRVMNARMLEDSYVLLGEINLGIAVDTEEGLVVPVVRNADELTVKGLARAIDELAEKARNGKLTPDDLAAKTFTISNPGRRGNMVGGAIISQPNVGILRTGEIKKRVVVVEHEGEDLMAIHPVMHVALSYDHRVVDGVEANGFLYRVVEILEAGDFTI